MRDHLYGTIVYGGVCEPYSGHLRFVLRWTNSLEMYVMVCMVQQLCYKVADKFAGLQFAVTVL